MQEENENFLGLRPEWEEFFCEKCRFYLTAEEKSAMLIEYEKNIKKE